ncbi:uridine kinase, partial [Candidatus Poribacteria bacterium]|nr:uridine kinase [Candidatus Poribacteria bacterium]
MTHQRVVIGIAGGTGSGKTTVARTIVQHIPENQLAVLSQDNYYHDLGHLPLEERETVNFDHPDSLDNDLLIEHIDTLRAGRAVERPVYNYAAHTRMKETVRVEPAPIIVVEGILVLVDKRLR